MDWTMHNSPLSLRDIRVTDAFWKNEMELVRTEVIPYQWAALNDQVKDAAPSYCMRNFKIAGKLNREKEEKGSAFEEPVYTYRGFEALPEDPEHLEDQFYGFVFQDSDFSKWIEAVGYSLTQHPDPKLEKIADEAIDTVCAAQQADGYLDTYYIINGRDKTFSNLRDHHELYCFGHLTEGAVAYYQATGKDKLLLAAERFADYIADTFGPEEGKCKGYPGHEIAEMALVRLYEATGEQKYLDLSRFFIDQRGTRPYYFDAEHPEDLAPGSENELRYQYQQAHLPVREQVEAVGHAVRAVYLYSGMADVARLTQDEELYNACEQLWDNIVTKKMYVTGSIGGTSHGEAFSFNYDLPNDTAYAETCAAIGLVFFARRMLEIHPQSRYADVMERALYNGVLSGMALDGKSFFYVNPLEVFPEACEKDSRKAHVQPVRQKWFGCACCPPNLARLLSSIASYAYTQTTDTLFVHLYIGSEITKQMSFPSDLSDLKDENPTDIFHSNAGETNTQSIHSKAQTDTLNANETAAEARVTVESALPWEGDVKIRVRAKGTAFRLALRIPDWAVSEELCAAQNAATALGSCGNVAAKDSPVTSQADANEDAASCPTANEALLSRLCSLLQITGLENTTLELRDGYLYLSKSWGEEDVFSLHFPIKPRLIAADPHVREDIGKAAVSRGPIVYCLEEADNGKDLHLLTLDSSAKPEIENIEICGIPTKAILWPGFRQDCEPTADHLLISDGWIREQKALAAGELRLSESESPFRSLYRPWKKPKKEAVRLKYIPYYMWANRSKPSGFSSTSEAISAPASLDSSKTNGAEMQVWTRVE